MLVTTDFQYMDDETYWGISQNIFFMFHRDNFMNGLEWHEQNFHCWVNYPFNVMLLPNEESMQLIS